MELLSAEVQNIREYKKTQSTQSPLSPKQKCSVSGDKFIFSDRPRQNISKINRVNQLRMEIAQREVSQLELEAKFKKCISHMLASIENSNKNNHLLAEQVHNLRTQIADNQHDIQIIGRVVNSAGWKEGLSKQELPVINTQKLLSSKKQLRSCNRPRNQLRTRTPTKLFSRMSIKPC